MNLNYYEDLICLKSKKKIANVVFDCSSCPLATPFSPFCKASMTEKEWAMWKEMKDFVGWGKRYT